MNRPVRVFGTGKQVRDIIHPKDVVRAFHAFYEHGEPGIYNIGGGVEYATSLLECIDLITDIMGKRPTVQFGEGRLGDLLYFVCDIQKAIRTLKWSPEIPPREGVRDLLGWLEEEKDLFKKDIL
jgi:CDP-paratose 2-epimerase